MGQTVAVARYEPRHAAARTPNGNRRWWVAAFCALVLTLLGAGAAVTVAQQRPAGTVEAVVAVDDREENGAEQGDEPAAAPAVPDADPLPSTTVPSTTVPSTTVPSATVPSTTTTAAAPPEPERSVTVAFGGDVLIHGAVWEAARTADGYDFSPMFDPVAGLLQGADVAICHLEVTLGRPGEPPTGYPMFRAPPELATDLAEAGFDGCSVASNHSLDRGEAGVAATLDAMDAAGLRHAGTARSAEERDAPVLYKAGGLRIAHLSYSYGFNGFTRPRGKEWLVNEIEPGLIVTDAAAARSAGADAVIVSLHWGVEYRHDIQPDQRAVAEALEAYPGAVDLVVGHHAHVVQPISRVGDLWVVWGLGNMLSNNTTACCPTTVADGLLVTVELTGSPGAGAAVSGVRYTPTWNERSGFRVLPAAASLAGPGLPPDLAAQLRASFERTSGHVLSAGGAAHGVVADLEPPPG
jgi:hypothetical protein